VKQEWLLGACPLWMLRAPYYAIHPLQAGGVSNLLRFVVEMKSRENGSLGKTPISKVLVLLEGAFASYDSILHKILSLLANTLSFLVLDIIFLY
jgi:hypothetical protein